ncbi:MAG: hypothetical protein WC408_04020 [Candidatus Micrarchaeia archaeon]|jgi:hypothetical protein
MGDELDCARADFINKFAALPNPLRNEIVVVVEDKPFTWGAAYLEVSQNTASGDQILKILKNLKII